jgi:chemotaxis protein methyltransferase CheR
MKVLEKARTGLYSQFEVQRGMPIKYLMKYFNQVGEMWQISEELKSMVEYRSMNLLDNFIGMHNYDVVFCRNVLIYFEPELKTKVLEKIRKSMHVDGVLFLGAAETVLGITDKFKPVTGSRGMYRTADGLAAQALRTA